MLIRSLVELQRVELGYDPGHVVTFQVSLPPVSYDQTRQITFFRDLLREVRSIPGVQSAAVSSAVPFGAGLFTHVAVRGAGALIAAARRVAAGGLAAGQPRLLSDLAHSAATGPRLHR